MSRKIIIDLKKLEDDFLSFEHNSLTLAKKYQCSSNTILRNLKSINNHLITSKLLELKSHNYNKVKHLCNICDGDNRVTYVKKIDTYLCAKHRGQFDKFECVLKITKYDKNEIIENEQFIEIIIRDVYSNKIASATADLEDIDKIKKYKWHLNEDGYVVYIDECSRFISLHYVILGLDNYTNTKFQIDHIDKNPLNNKKENLRKSTRQQNLMNRNLFKNNKSGITGVYWSDIKNKWISQIKYNKKSITLGSFKNKENAIASRLKAEIKYFGEFAPQKYLFEEYLINNDVNSPSSKNQKAKSLGVPIISEEDFISMIGKE